MIAMIGEARHRRSYVLTCRRHPQALFHNNTIRTIAPEYPGSSATDADCWSSPSVMATPCPPAWGLPHGFRAADSREDLRTRLRANLAAEEALREGRRLYAPIAAAVKRSLKRRRWRGVQLQKALFDFD